MSQQSSRIVTILIVLALVVFGVILISRRTPNVPNNGTTPTSTQPVTPTSTEPQTPTSTEPNNGGATSTTGVVRPKPAGTICDSQNFICVPSTTNNALLSNPISVTGTAIAFENQFAWQLQDPNGNVIEQGSVMANAPDAGQPGPFTIRAFYTTTTRATSGVLVLFEPSPKDGTPTHVLRIPVRIPTQTMTVNVYLPTVNSSDTDCKTVAPVKRTIMKTVATAEAALRELTRIKSTDTINGMKTSLSDGTELISLVVNKGVAKAVFNDLLDQNVGGSCRVSSIRSQIEKTLTQYPTIKSVEISTQTKSAGETLQP